MFTLYILVDESFPNQANTSAFLDHNVKAFDVSWITSAFLLNWESQNGCLPYQYEKVIDV